jgi:hypothetical protein
MCSLLPGSALTGGRRTLSQNGYGALRRPCIRDKNEPARRDAMACFFTLSQNDYGNNTMLAQAPNEFSFSDKTKNGFLTKPKKHLKSQIPPAESWNRLDSKYFPG